MAANPQLPRAQAPVTERGDPATREYYEFWRQLLQFVLDNGGTPAQIAEIEARLAALESGGSGIVKGEQSIFTAGALPNVVTVTLLNDDATPGNTYYYGTGPTGTKGWFASADAVAGADSVVKTVGSDGVSTFNLDGDDPSPDPLSSYATDLGGNKGWFRPALFESTGLLAWSAPYLAVNAGDPTKFDVGAAVVGYTDYDTNPVAPTRAYAVYGPTTGNAVPNLANIATWVGIQTPGATLVTQSSAFTPTQRRTIVQLGAVISNGTQLIAVNDLPVVMRAGINQIGDFMRAVGPINSGNLISPNGANLQIDKGAGVIFKEGANFVNNADDPHNLALPSLTAATFAYRTSTGVQAANTTSINVTQYESSPGVLSTVSNNRFTVQRIYVFTSNLIRIQYGQTEYQTMAAAEAAIVTQPFNTEANIAENGVLLAFLIVEKSATALNNPAQAKFIPASKFGGPVGSGGTSITTTDALPEGLVNLYFTNERAQDAVGLNLLDTSTVNLTYNDATGQISADVIPGGLSGSFQPLDADLTAIAALAATGFPTRTAANTWAQRSFPNGTGYTWTNPAGIAGNPTLVLSTNLQTWSGLTPSAFDSAGSAASALAAANAYTDDGLALKGNLAGGNSWTGSQTFDGTTLFVDSVNDRIGIGTTSPLFQFHVEGSTAGLYLNRTGGLEAFVLLSMDGVSKGQIRSRSAGGLKVTDGTGATEWLRLEQDFGVIGGRLYGTALHNNASGIAGTTNQYVGSGTYTPTLTNVANIDASTSNTFQFMRVGNVVTVSGTVNIDTTAASTLTQLGISLPIASAMTSFVQCCGTATSQVANAFGQIQGDSTNDRAELRFSNAATTDNRAWFLTFTYLVL